VGRSLEVLERPRKRQDGSRLLDVPRPAKVHFVNCLAAVLLAGLLGLQQACAEDSFRPGRRVVPVSDAMAADVSNDPVDFGGSGTATDTIIDNLEAGVAAQDAGGHRHGNRCGRSRCGSR